MNGLDLLHRVKGLALPAVPTRANLAALAEELAALTALLSDPAPLDPLPILPWPEDLAGGLRFQGYASRWTPDSRGDQRQRGDFAAGIPRYLAAGGPLFLGHDARYPIGRVMAVQEEDDGLTVSAFVFPALNEEHQTIIDGLLAGIVRGMSWSGFLPDPRNVCINEVCVTRYPGHPDATIVAVQPL